MNTESLLVYGLPAGAYLLGSIPWGVVLARAAGAEDPRVGGSGNIGATNVARLAGPAWGAATLAADTLKGLLPVGAALAWAPEGLQTGPYPVAVALAAFLGHLFPLATGFRGGGKGVATAAGGFALIAPTAVLLAAGVFALLAGASRRVSVGSLAGAAALPAAVWFGGGSGAEAAGAALAAAGIWIRHAANLRRLAAGTEPAFRFRRP